MDRNSPYYRQVQLLLRVLPMVFREACFALKGGTAINLFVRDMPRLSVDIDLVYLPVHDRGRALANARAALDRIADAVAGALPGVRLVKAYLNKADVLRLLVEASGASIKIELSPVLRGTVYAPQRRPVVRKVEDEFGFAEGPVVALQDLYAGKLCAALDRQHPRDFFDVWLLLQNEGIDDALRKAFIAYLVSHERPMEELLAPRWKPLEKVFTSEFQGMTLQQVTVAELQAAMRQALAELLSGMTGDEKTFLCSVYEGDAQWSRLGLPDAQHLPAVRWKLANIAKMDEAKRQSSLRALKAVLGGE